MEKINRFGLLNAPVGLVTREATRETTLSRACASAAALRLSDIPVAIQQEGEVLFESLSRDVPPQGDETVITAVQGLAEDILEDWATDG